MKNDAKATNIYELYPGLLWEALRGSFKAIQPANRMEGFSDNRMNFAEQVSSLFKPAVSAKVFYQLLQSREAVRNHLSRVTGFGSIIQVLCHGLTAAKSVILAQTLQSSTNPKIGP